MLSIVVDCYLKCIGTSDIDLIVYEVSSIILIECFNAVLVVWNLNQECVATHLKLVVARIEQSNNETLHYSSSCICYADTADNGVSRIRCGNLANYLERGLSNLELRTRATRLQVDRCCISTGNHKSVLNLIHAILKWSNDTVHNYTAICERNVVFVVLVYLGISVHVEGVNQRNFWNVHNRCKHVLLVSKETCGLIGRGRNDCERIWSCLWVQLIE